VLAGVLLCTQAIYGTVFYATSGSLSGGDPINAEAEFTFGTDSIEITLTNLITDQIDVGQNLNGVSFHVPGSFGGIGITSFGSNDRTGIVDNIAFDWTDVSDSTNHWFFTDPSNDFDLTTIGNPAARYTIVGGPNAGTPPSAANEYTQANSGSLQAGNNHEPFLAVSATWLLSVPGITAADEAEITNVSFSFGTQTNEGGSQPGSPCPTCTGQSTTPEPLALWLMGSGLLFLYIGHRARQRASTSKRPREPHA
jgi:hypothetical protein